MTINVGGKTTAGNPSIRQVVDNQSKQEIAGEKTFVDATKIEGETTITNTLHVTGTATFDETIEGTARAAYWA